MNPKLLLVSLAMVVSTTFATAGQATISPSGDPLEICDSVPYLELNAVGNNANHIYTWTVNDDIYAYGETFYYVPELGGANNTIRLYKGVIVNGTVDIDPNKLLDEVSVNVSDCEV